MTIILLMFASALMAAGIALFILSEKFFKLENDLYNTYEDIDLLFSTLEDQRKINDLAESKLKELEGKKWKK